MNNLSAEWNKENFLLAAMPVAVWGDDRAFRAAEECYKSMAISESVVSVLKYATNRRRPSGTHSRSNSSFPSSHASTSFAAAAAIGSAYPKARIPAYLIASLIAYSRVYNQRHYPTDVLAGAAIGVLSARASRAYLAWLHVDRAELADRIPFRVTVDSNGRGLLRLYFSRKF
jgi:membrane-associated phospholipid phosphatase